MLKQPRVQRSSVLNRGALTAIRNPSETEDLACGVDRQRRTLARERVQLTLRGKSLARLLGLSLPATWRQERVFPELEPPDELRAKLASWQLILPPIEVELSAFTEPLQGGGPRQLAP